MRSDVGPAGEEGAHLAVDLAGGSQLNELLMDSLPHPAMLVRVDRVVLAANQVAREAGAQIGGYCWEHFGKCEYIPAEDRHYVEEHGAPPPGGTRCTHCLADDALEAGEPRNDGSVHAFGRVWDTYWIPLHGGVYLHYAVDVTARTELLEAVQRSETKFRELFAQAPIGMAVYDARGQLQEVNIAWRETFGLEPEAPLPSVDLFTDPHMPRTVREELRQGERARFQAWYERAVDNYAEGCALPVTRAYLDISLTPLNDDTGEEPRGFLAQVQDLTAREHAERELLAAQRNLANRVRQRTALLRDANEALKEQVRERGRAEERLAKAQALVHLGNWEWSIPEDHLKWSDETYRIFGRRRDSFEPSYRAFLECVHPDDRARVESAVDAALRKQAPYDVDHRIVRPDGQTRTVQERAEVTLGDSGQPVRMLGTVRDITEQREQERELQETMALLERIFDTTHMLIAYLDTGFNFIRVNRAYARAGGLSQQEFVGRNHFDLYPHEENEAIFRRALHTGEPAFVHRKPFVYPDDPDERVTYWDWSLQPVHDSEGHIEGLLLCLLDVTEREEARRGAEEQRQLLQTIVDSIPIMLVFFASSGKVRLVNREMEHLTGWSSGELTHLSELAESLPDEETARRLSKHLIGGEPGWWDVQMLGRFGRLRETCWAVVSLDDDHSIGIGIDITERKEAERRIRTYQNELRSLTAQLVHVEDEERRRLATLVHDQIGQSLALSKMRLGAVQEDLADERLSGELSDVRQTIQGTIDYVRSLMFELSPPILYEMGLEPALEKLTRNTQEQHGIAVHYHSDARSDSVPEHLRMMLYRCVQELLINAVRHAQPQRIVVSTSQRQGTLRITVEDDGMGFDDSEAGFHKHRYGGFGLFSIRERLDHLGGRMELESRPGCGTTVSLVVPLISNGQEPAGGKA